jgi:MtN3 and saliva related transmembrane protein
MLISYVDKIFFIACMANASLFLPQIRLLYKTKDSSSVSLTMFLCFNIIQAITVLHGYLHNDLYLTLGFALSFISCGCVTALIIYYRAKGR